MSSGVPCGSVKGVCMCSLCSFVGDLRHDGHVKVETRRKGHRKVTNVCLILISQLMD